MSSGERGSLAKNDEDREMDLNVTIGTTLSGRRNKSLSVKADRNDYNIPRSFVHKNSSRGSRLGSLDLLAMKTSHMTLEEHAAVGGADKLGVPSKLPRSSSTGMNDIYPSSSKIICTIGPKTASIESLTDLIEAGLNVARLNFSHGDHNYHGKVITNVRAACAVKRSIVAILLDTKGPEIRTCLLKDHKDVILTKGNEFTLYTDPEYVGDESGVGVHYTNLPKVLTVGDSILIDDGLIELRVDKLTDTTVHTTVLNTGELGERKGVNLPGAIVDLPAITEKDTKDILFGVEMGVDFIAASFVRKAADVLAIRQVLGEKGKNIKIISKIENQEGLENFQDILKVSDGIMVARGDLGVEIPLDQVSVAQKMMIRKCNEAGKPVITATQMLESMIKNPSPTRAEASDVANAVMDGTDCVMLSGETAKGSYPVEAVEMMSSICKEVEFRTHYSINYLQFRKQAFGSDISVAESIASSAVNASFDLKATLIIVLTETGRTARLVAKYRPKARILAVTSSDTAARQCMIVKGVYPMLVGSTAGTDSLTSRIVDTAKKLGMCNIGDKLVVVSGTKEGNTGNTNDLKIVSVSY